jgi:hypothetical protein
MVLPSGNKHLETIVNDMECMTVESPEVPDDDEEAVDILKNKPNSRRRKLKSASESAQDLSQPYSDYHIDVWYLISRFIDPEDVKRFALICTKTAQVIESAQFWIRLYKQHYSEGAQVPMRFQPECMVRLCGLRANTIRSLFYCYDPFVERLKSANVRQDIHISEKKQVMACWSHQSSSKVWNFYFKLKSRLSKSCRATVAERKRRDHQILEYLSDVCANPDEGCQILQLCTTGYRPLPQFFGQSVNLFSINQTLSHGFCHYKITLKFTSRINDQLMGAVTFDPVLSARVYDWWTPDYLSLCS